ncbi:hypothetical protein QTG56_14135 [Rossellomorea sp. AcN35-11]|nr:hypothetical protein [Rossellomorea aquimaris]WJV28252.1 hypothetical protein QTG56_14135 [Rossellomorea sp. AcN35-11]
MQLSYDKTGFIEEKETQHSSLHELATYVWKTMAGWFCFFYFSFEHRFGKMKRRGDPVYVKEKQPSTVDRTF